MSSTDHTPKGDIGTMTVADLTRDILARAEWWVFLGRPVIQWGGSPQYKDVIRTSNLWWDNGCYGPDTLFSGFSNGYHHTIRCYPVSIDKDGNETRVDLKSLEELNGNIPDSTRKDGSAQETHLKE